MKRALALSLLLSGVASAQAQAPAPPAPAVATAAAPFSDKVFTIGAHLGMGIPQLFSKLRNFGVYELELGFLLPVWGRRVQVGVMFEYSEPGSGGGEPDPRLATASGDYRWDLSNRMLILELAFLIRAFALGTFINPYARAGFRVYLLDTQVWGNSAGNQFGQYDEKFTEPGFMVGGGVEVRLGPGAFNAEVRVDYSNMNRRLSGDSNNGMLTIVVGYRFFL